MGKSKDLAELAGVTSRLDTLGASSGSLGNRNAITNGGMTIDQRNSGSATTPSTDRTYTLDRWLARMSSGSKYSVQQVADAPSGYYNSLKVTSLAATTVGSTDYYQINTPLEGYNVTRFDLGLSTAKKLTLSFWVKSSLTGTFGGAYSNNAGNRFYAWTYTISSANTWEHKTVTVDGVTDGSWERTNGAGLWVYWTLGAGSGITATAGAWGTTFKRGPTGATNVVATNAATWQITGCQLEVGSGSTDFEEELPGVTLNKCERYFQTYSKRNWQGTNEHVANYYMYCDGVFRQKMRAAPTATFVGTITIGRPQVGVSQRPNEISGLSSQGFLGFKWPTSGTYGGQLGTHGDSYYRMYVGDGPTNRIDFDAEL